MATPDVAVSPPPEARPEPQASADATLAFADALLADGDFYRAITEYKRFLFLHPEAPEAERARLAIGTAYARGGQAPAAIAYYAQLEQAHAGAPLGIHAQLEVGYARALAGEVETSITALSTWLDAHAVAAAPDDAARARYLLGWSHLTAGHDADAHAAFAATPPFPRRDRLLAAVLAMTEVPTRSPALAGVLSLVPGLGHLYLGQPGIALAALAWNGLFGFGVYDALRRGDWGVAAVLGVFELLWYSGTIFGAVSGAHKYNRDARLEAVEALKRQFNAQPEAWPPDGK